MPDLGDAAPQPVPGARRGRPGRPVRTQRVGDRLAHLQHQNDEQDRLQQADQFQRARVDRRGQAQRDRGLKQEEPADGHVHQALQPHVRVHRRLVADVDEPKRWSQRREQHPQDDDDPARDDDRVQEGDDRDPGHRVGAGHDDCQAGGYAESGHGQEIQDGSDRQRRRPDAQRGRLAPFDRRAGPRQRPVREPRARHARQHGDTQVEQEVGPDPTTLGVSGLIHDPSARPTRVADESGERPELGAEDGDFPGDGGQQGTRRRPDRRRRGPGIEVRVDGAQGLQALKEPRPRGIVLERLYDGRKLLDRHVVGLRAGGSRRPRLERAEPRDSEQNGDAPQRSRRTVHLVHASRSAVCRRRGHGTRRAPGPAPAHALPARLSARFMAAVGIADGAAGVFAFAIRCAMVSPSFGRFPVISSHSSTN